MVRMVLDVGVMHVCPVSLKFVLGLCLLPVCMYCVLGLRLCNFPGLLWLVADDDMKVFYGYLLHNKFRLTRARGAAGRVAPRVGRAAPWFSK